MPAAALWICCWAYFNVLGWLLSAVHELNAISYAAGFFPLAVAVTIWIRKHPLKFQRARLIRRFRRPLPAIFLFLVVLIAAGGVLYAPSNYDALTYRLPRMLNWFSEGRWFWIPAVNERVNYSGPGWEWAAMPLFALTHSDRFLFLIDFSGYLLMPGLLFSIFRQLGIARRVAWTWMWILPLAYGYATQAASIGNDLAGAVLVLASIFYGLRARQSGSIYDVWLALIAAAAMTAVKLSNLPLALPCLVVMWPALKSLRKNPFKTAAIFTVAAMASAIPLMILNQTHTGNWTGDPDDRYKMQIKNPVAALLGNSVLLAEQSLMPPVLPGSHSLNETVESKLPGFLKRDYPRLKSENLNEIPTEECAGIGLGITTLLLAGVVLNLSRRKAMDTLRLDASILFAAAWIAVLAYMSKMGSEAAARLMLPYYPLMLAPLLMLPGQRLLQQSRAGRILALLAAMSVLPALVLSPARPLWPGETVCCTLAAAHPGHLVLQRMATAYSTYAHRNDILASLRDKLPADAREIGFVAGDNDTDYSLWRPFGQRSVVYPSHDVSHFLANPGEVKWLVVKNKEWPQISNAPLAAWAQTNQFKIVFSTNIVELVGWGSERWDLLHHEP